MGLFDVLGGKQNPGDYLVGVAGKGLKAGVGAAKNAAAKAKEKKEARREAEQEEEAYDDGSGPAFCPHCGKPLR
jgi:ribosomal protein L12E/L44/L45/RPP1/RPP2